VTDQNSRDNARPFVSLQSLNDDTALFDVVPDEGQLSLAEPATVDMLLRHYTKFLIDHAVAYYDDNSLTNKNLALMEAEASRLQDVFYGRDPAYKGTTWNRPEGLGKFLVDVNKVAGTPDEAVATLLGVFWLELRGPLIGFYSGKTSKEVFADAFVGDLVDAFARMLMGLPEPPDDDEED